MAETPEKRAAQAMEQLAAGGLRGPESGAWSQFQLAWPEVIGRVAGFLRSMGVPRDSAEDCGQAALLRVWRFRTSYRGASTPELTAWMYRICRNEAARLIEAGERTNALDEPTSIPDVAPGIGGADTAEAADDRRALEECVQGLEPKQRSVLELLYAATPMTEREVERVLDVSKSYVHALRRAALELLKRCLERKGGK